MNEFLMIFLRSVVLSSLMLYVLVRFSQLIGIEEFTPNLKILLVIIWFILVGGFLVLSRYLF